jgi:hypothetical protein
MVEAHKGLAINYAMLENYVLAWQHIQIVQELGGDVPDDLLAVIEENLPTE